MGYNVFPGNKEYLLGRYCGNSAPGPVESLTGAVGLKVVLRTDEEGVYNGFQARYFFQKITSAYGDCGGDLSVTRASSGVFTSPKWPEKYDRSSGPHSCHWNIRTNNGSRILLHFQSFSIEGDPESRGCSAATVRIWKKPSESPVEICGERLRDADEQHLSSGDLMSVTFITADKVAGGRGFRAVWTEIRPGSGLDCDQFLCQNSSFCIDKNLRCDGVVNCGRNDDSDESHCMEELVEESSLVLVVSLAACALALLATLCIVCHRKRHRRRRPNVVSRERRPFAPASCPGLESSRPSLSLPSEVPPAPSLFTSLPPLSIDSADHV